MKSTVFLNEHPCVTASRQATLNADISFNPETLIRTGDKNYAYASREDTIAYFETQWGKLLSYYGGPVEESTNRTREEVYLADGYARARRLTVDLELMKVSVSAFGNVNSGYPFWKI